MNTWLSFRSAQASKVARFSVGDNTYSPTEENAIWLFFEIRADDPDIAFGLCLSIKEPDLSDAPSRN